MDRNSPYFKQVQLLVRILPLIAVESCFALKGGTAINLFVRDLPRLSVDIDLVYLPMDERTTALANIRAALDRIATTITSTFQGVQVQKSYESQQDALRLMVQLDGAKVKIELSPVLRGTVFPEQQLAVRPKVEELFGLAEMPVVSFPDLYAGKICAALDRQHPRDLFDIKFMLDNEGLTDDVRKTFLVYLISHNRTMSELLRPVRKGLRTLYEGEFQDMTEIEVTLGDLEAAREQLITTINHDLTEDERKFLLSFKGREPDWSLLDLENIDKLPAVQWKMLNLRKMSAKKHQDAFEALRDILDNPPS